MRKSHFYMYMDILATPRSLLSLGTVAAAALGNSNPPFVSLVSSALAAHGMDPPVSPQSSSPADPLIEAEGPGFPAVCHPAPPNL